MVALSALHAHDEAALLVIPERAAHHAQVLFVDEVVRGGDANHLTLLLLFLFLAGVGGGALRRRRRIISGGRHDCSRRRQELESFFKDHGRFGFAFHLS